MSIQLKIKIKSLAAEAAIIRDEERRIKRRSWWSPGAPIQFWGTFGPDENRSPANEKRLGRFNLLRHHRHHAVRPEARATLLAYGFLRGRAYRRIENKCHEPPNWKAVATMVFRYGQDSDALKALNSRTVGEIADSLKVWAESDTVQLAT